MLPNVQKVVSVEQLRDGGSFAAKFESDDGNRYMLFTKILLVDCGPEQKNERGIRQEKELAGFEQPVLIDCDPAKRPQNTKTAIYGDLHGPHRSVTWGQARQIIGELAQLAQNLRPIQAGWLQEMTAVVATDGRPPNISRRSTWQRIS